MRELKEICVCRIDRIGDLIMTTPILRTIRQEWPKSKITLLASNINSMVLNNSPLVDEIIIVKDKNNFLRQIKILKIIRQRSFDLFINFSPNNLGYFFCYFSKSKIKTTMIFKSRYKKKFSKLIIQVFSKIFCHHIYIVDRHLLYKKNIDFHQTKMMFALLEKISKKSFVYPSLEIPVSSPLEGKINELSKKIVTIHLSNRWLNRHYTIESLQKLIIDIKNYKNYIFFLTTEKFKDQGFIKITRNYKNLYDFDFLNKNMIYKKINKENIFILDFFKYNDWVSIIKQSEKVITPEGGCVHIAAAFNKNIIVIYNRDNAPDYIYKEYSPWKTSHKKLIFGEKNINNEILADLN